MSDTMTTTEPAYGYESVTNDPIEWTYDDDLKCWKAWIGLYTTRAAGASEFETETAFVWGFYWRKKTTGWTPNPNTLFHWEVRICDGTCANPAEGWIVGFDDSRSPRKAQKAAEFIGKEWLKGDSPLWNEGGGDDGDGQRSPDRVRSESTTSFDHAC